jgi:hypothetical protein
VTVHPFRFGVSLFSGGTPPPTDFAEAIERLR